jgi:hypothetical protein
MAVVQSPLPVHVSCQRVVHLERGGSPVECVLASDTKLLLPASLASHLSVGDEISFPVNSPPAPLRTEIRVKKNSFSGRSRELYQAPIGYATEPRKDKRGRLQVYAQVPQGLFGIDSVLLPCEVLREYFYSISSDRQGPARPTLYELLRMPTTASPAELRVGFKLRDLELRNDNAPRVERVALERAFNILGQPELRACYDALLADSEAAAVFPYGGFGSLLVAGERSRDGRTFFAHRILAFLPEQRQRRFRAAMRHCDFYDDRALCRDARRRLELWIDPAVLHITWDATWNQWKHLLPTKMEVSATFVESGNYRRRRGEWELVQRETALPSRLEIKLPDEFQEQLDKARTTYRRFGQYSSALDRIRACIEHRAVEKAELERICFEHHIPGDLDVAQISWRPDYDPFFYRQLSRRARRIYLFRDEYIFDLEKTVVVETPQLGHATYIFAKPRSMDGFLATYTKITKEDIRRNRDDIAARLGYLGRIIHGVDPKLWVKDLKCRIGEVV